MTEEKTSYRGTRFFLNAAAFVIILWGINLAQPVLVLFLVAGFLATIGMMPLLWLERKGLHSAAAVFLVMAAMIILLSGIGILVGTSLSSFYDALPLYQTRFHEMLVGFRSMLAKRGITVTDKILLGYINPGMVMNFTASLFTSLSSALSNTLLILFLVIFVLLEASIFPAKLRLALDKPQADFPRVTRFFNEIKHYLVIKTVINLAGATLIIIFLSVLGVDFAVLWGFLAFLLAFVPTVGSIMAAIPAVLLAFIQFGGGTAALTAAGYLVIGMILGNVIEPKIMGRKLGMSTLTVFVALIFWGSLLGPVGALLCVPLTLCLRLVCEMSEDTRWLAVLLGPDAPR
ncbi:MAG TPA: AI-2E family transporter [Bacteroidota bacterium]|nr:AI-2E family transporter [Bacteroidota bacterium]